MRDFSQGSKRNVKKDTWTHGNRQLYTCAHTQTHRHTNCLNVYISQFSQKHSKLNEGVVSSINISNKQRFSHERYSCFLLICRFLLLYFQHYIKSDLNPQYFSFTTAWVSSASQVVEWNQILLPGNQCIKVRSCGLHQRTGRKKKTVKRYAINFKGITVTKCLHCPRFYSSVMNRLHHLLLWV